MNILLVLSSVSFPKPTWNSSTTYWSAEWRQPMGQQTQTCAVGQISLC